MKLRSLPLFAFFFLLLTSCSTNKLQNLVSEKGLSGSITIYDQSKDTWIYSDAKDAEAATIPASTFKIVNSLILLEEQVIQKDTMLKWDKVVRTFKEKEMKSWNKDSNLEDAFKNSTVWFYEKASRKIPREKYAQYLNRLNYGNGDLSEEKDDFWNYGNFGVTPKEQILFLVSLYNESLPFQKENMATVKSLMRQEKTNGYRFYAKTGWGIKEDTDIGWYVGYLEANGNVYFFATRLRAKPARGDFGSHRKELTIKAFQSLQIIPDPS